MTESVLTLIVMVALLLGSPGPAPLALAVVGASFGVVRGLPFLLGILTGLLFAIVGAGIGLSTLFSFYPTATILVQMLGGVYILYVAFKIAFAPVTVGVGASDNIPSFVDGFILNLLNPKAYAAFFAIFAQFTLPLENHPLSILSTAVICLVVAIIVDGVWLMLGGIIGPIFKQPRQARFLRITFAATMIVVVCWTLFNVNNA